jgi:hypothetical protein
VAVIGFLACGGGSGGTDVAPAADPGSAVDTVAPAGDAIPAADVPATTDTRVDTVTGATKRMLDDTHAGWQKPACWTCHTADAHNDGKDPYACVPCHGTNGAGPGHAGADPCGSCHSPAHADTGFPDPLSCKSCHP